MDIIRVKAGFSHGLGGYVTLHYHLVEKIENKVLGTPRERNQKHSHDFLPEYDGWKKYGHCPIYGSKKTGTVFDPYAYIEDSIFYMCASERKTGDIILLQSADGKKWNFTSTMLSHIPNTWEHEINRGCVVKTDSCYYLWYTGQQDGKSNIGVAISYDGKKYSRIQKKPVLMPNFSYEGISVMNPCVIWDESLRCFRMWYSAGENYEPDIICYAESKDGIHWRKSKGAVLAKNDNNEWEKYKVGGCQVIKTFDKEYIMYYIGYQNVDVARICYATSEDGIHWDRTKNNLLLAPSSNSWDFDAVYKPTVVRKNDSLFLYYNGRKDTEEYIGLAIKKLRKNNI